MEERRNRENMEDGKGRQNAKNVTQNVTNTISFHSMKKQTRLFLYFLSSVCLPFPYFSLSLFYPSPSFFHPSLSPSFFHPFFLLSFLDVVVFLLPLSMSASYVWLLGENAKKCRVTLEEKEDRGRERLRERGEREGGRCW